MMLADLIGIYISFFIVALHKSKPPEHTILRLGRCFFMKNNDFEKVYNEYKQQGENQARMEVDKAEDPAQEQIVAVRKKDDGDIIAFKTESGSGP